MYWVFDKYKKMNKCTKIILSLFFLLSLFGCQKDIQEKPISQPQVKKQERQYSVNEYFPKVDTIFESQNRIEWSKTLVLKFPQKISTKNLFEHLKVFQLIEGQRKKDPVKIDNHTLK